MRLFNRSDGTAMSVPFFGKPFTFTQPDGTTLQVRSWGDQHAASFETLDGYAVVLNDTTGFYEIAALTDDGTDLVPTGVAPGGAPPDGVAPGLRAGAQAMRTRAMQQISGLGPRRCDERRRERKETMLAMRAARANGAIALAPPQRSTVGDYLGLCILVDFSDAPATITQQEVNAFCNDVGYTGFGNNGSVFDYFLENSIGRCRYRNLVTPYYRASKPKSYYTDHTKPFGSRARELIVEALTHLKATGFDMSALTADTGGNVYATNVFYAGPVANNWSQGLWPHSSALSTKFTVAPGKAARDYQVTALGSELDLGTFCHENGHMLCDYPDLYDYGSQSSGVGSFCLMCAGNFSEKNPTQISAYLKRMSGWANSTAVLQHGSTTTLAVGTNDFAIHAKSDTEYFLIENRAKAGRDSQLPDAGLAIWHVDELGSNNDEQMTPAKHYELSLEQADGTFQFERSASWLGDKDDLHGGTVAVFSPTTVPSSLWWDGTSSDLTIDQISAPAPAMTFRSLLSSGPFVPAVVQGTSSPALAIPDNNVGGVSDTINIADAVSILAVRVGVDITHTFRGDLVVSLTSPWGEAVILHPKNRGGGENDLHQVFDDSSVPAFTSWRGRQAVGSWKLTVQDLAAQDIGTFDAWRIEIDPAPPTSDVVLAESPGTQIPDSSPAGITRSLSCAAAGVVGSVEVSVDITHPYSGDLRINLRSPTGTVVALRDRVGAAEDNVVATFTAATVPALTGLVGQPRLGDWHLIVADVVGADIGKLNSWGLTIR
jgi:M6 family metalloprotease-like protein